VARRTPTCPAGPVRTGLGVSTTGARTTRRSQGGGGLGPGARLRARPHSGRSGHADRRTKRPRSGSARPAVVDSKSKGCGRASFTPKCPSRNRTAFFSDPCVCPLRSSVAVAVQGSA
jgi:hypothetical protein